MDMPKLFEKTENCFGCSACKSICPVNAISLISDNEGFLYPEIDEKLCIKCQSCVKVCPQKKHSQDTNTEEQYPSGDSIGIINLQVTDNYGANLLAYALQTKISQLYPEREVYTIDASVKEKTQSFDEKVHNKINYIVGKIKKYKFKLPAMFIAEKRAAKKNAVYNAQKHSAFAKFRDEFLNLTPMCQSSEAIASLPIDTVVLGSDIVWSTDRAETDAADVFFAAKLSPHYNKLSYAASIGTDDESILTPLEGVYKENLKNINYISMREKNSAEYIQKLTDKKVYQCCDPAFLLSRDEWSELSKKAQTVQENKYIFVYLLNRCPSGIKAAKKLAKEKGLKVIYSTSEPVSFGKNSYCCNGCGPLEFLNYLKNAEYVITNSFHSLVFSIIFHKQFKVYFRDGQNLKLTNLLDKYNMQSRYDCKTDIDEPIDFEYAEKMVKDESDYSIKYLKTAINKE